MANSIRTKLLIVVCISYILSTAAIVGFGIVITKQIITSENEKAYTHQLEVILRTLQKRHEKLTASEMAGLFADGYKKSSAKDLGELHYAANQTIYPFIIDTAGLVVLHPTLVPGSAEVASLEFIHKMLSAKNGTLRYQWRGHEKWMVFRTFEPWHWTIGYAIKAKDKYASVQKVVKNLAVIMVLSSLLGLVVIYTMLSRIVGPIRVLAEDARIIGDGQYDHQVAEVKGQDEIARLAASLSLMAQNISDRDKEIRGFNEQLEQRVQQRTAALEESQERFRDVALSSADWIWELDRDGHYIYSSGRVKEILGFDHDEIIGKTAYDLMPQEEAVRMSGFFQEAGLKKQAIVDLENWNLTKEGKSVCLLTNGVPVFSKTGALLGYRGVDKDITERKHYEDELKRAKEAAEAATRAKSEFLANMSHEIRTPMNGIIGMAGLLAQTELDQEQREFAHTVQSSADALLSIINDILDFSKIEAGKLEFEILDLDLQSTVEDVAEILAIKAHEKGLEFGIVLQPSVPQYLQGDPGRLKQILINLCTNAIKFTEQGEIVIRIFLEQEDATHATLRFAVTDTGIGIPESRRDRLFKAFSQVDTSTTRMFGGTGLGLVISKQLVEMMQGQIGVESEKDKGSTFWFTAVFAKQPAANHKIFIVPSDIKGKRVLVVDDNSVNREILASYLKLWECRFSSVSSAPEALMLMYRAIKSDDPYDLAIIDHMMPDMGGEELALSIQANPALGGTKMIMLTSRGMRGDAAKAKKLGYDAYLTKPIKRQQLFNGILAVFGRAADEGLDDTDKGLITRHSLKELQRINAKILVVEDNKTNQKVALNILKKFGCRADAAANGQEAVESFKTIPYDLILMDVQMPVLDGMSATRKIRALEKELPAEKRKSGDRITIIAMTAGAMKGDQERCLAAGMDDYLAKPVRPEELRAKLVKWLPADGNTLKMVQKDHNGQAGQANPQSPDHALREAIDMKSAIERAMGDVSFFKMMISEFQQQKKDYLQNIHAAIESQDPAKIKMEAHSLKGAAANLGLIQIHKVAMVLEETGDTGKFSEASQALEQLQDHYQHLDQYVSSLDWNALMSAD